MAGAMRAGRKADERGAAVSADFAHALTQQVLRTELVRIKALIATDRRCSPLMLWTVYMLDPDAVDHHLARPASAGLPLCDPDPVHPVRAVGACAPSAGI